MMVCMEAQEISGGSEQQRRAVILLDRLTNKLTEDVKHYAQELNKSEQEGKEERNTFYHGLLYQATFTFGYVNHSLRLDEKYVHGYAICNRIILDGRTIYEMNGGI